MLRWQCSAVRVHITHCCLSSGPKCDVTFMSSRDNRWAEGDYGCFENWQRHKVPSPALSLSPPLLFSSRPLSPPFSPASSPPSSEVCRVHVKHVASVIYRTKGPQTDSSQTIAPELPGGSPGRGGVSLLLSQGKEPPRWDRGGHEGPLAYCECWKV